MTDVTVGTPTCTVIKMTLLKRDWLSFFLQVPDLISCIPFSSSLCSYVSLFVLSLFLVLLSSCCMFFFFWSMALVCVVVKLTAFCVPSPLSLTPLGIREWCQWPFLQLWWRVFNRHSEKKKIKMQIFHISSKSYDPGQSCCCHVFTSATGLLLKKVLQRVQSGKTYTCSLVKRIPQSYTHTVCRFRSLINKHENAHKMIWGQNPERNIWLIETIRYISPLKHAALDNV